MLFPTLLLHGARRGLRKFFYAFHEGAGIGILRFIVLPVNMAYSLVELRNMEGNSPVRLKAITQNIEKKKKALYFSTITMLG